LKLSLVVSVIVATKNSGINDDFSSNLSGASVPQVKKHKFTTKPPIILAMAIFGYLKT